jgi:predicted dehydrogenase
VTPLRIGILGAARIAPAALLRPAASVDGVEVVAVAARSRDRAARLAGRYGVSKALGGYAELLADPDVDAVYIPLPNGLHADWTQRALAAGKHVLCEKPLTANEAEAQLVAAAAASSGLVLMEAFHYRYHPLARRIDQILHGEQRLGAIRQVETWMCFPLPRFSDIRYRYDLAGGATMDAGCYALHAARFAGPGEPEVVGARAKLLRRGGQASVDRAMSIDLRYPTGATGAAHTSMWSSTLLKIGLKVTGERGELSVPFFVLPRLATLKLTVDGRTTREKVRGDSTYTYQLRAFRDAVGGADTNLTPPADSILTMRLVDAAYRAAGLEVRGRSSV